MNQALFQRRMGPELRTGDGLFHKSNSLRKAARGALGGARRGNRSRAGFYAGASRPGRTFSSRRDPANRKRYLLLCRRCCGDIARHRAAAKLLGGSTVSGKIFVGRHAGLPEFAFQVARETPACHDLGMPISW